MPRIVVRPAAPEEMGVVRRLMLAYGEHLAANPAGAENICLKDYDRELDGLPGQYQAPGGALFLVFIESEPAGCCSLRPIRRERVPERGCELKRLWVEPRLRGLGLGRRLMDAALAWATEAGYQAIYLDTVPAAMPEANRMYAALGFQPVERYNNNLVDGVMFFRRALATPEPSAHPGRERL